MNHFDRKGHNLKVGDCVRVVRGGQGAESLVVGAEHVVSGLSDIVSTVRVEGLDSYWNASRFERVAEGSRLTAEEQRIIDAARAWAKAERALRTFNDSGITAPETRRRVNVMADYTEQMLLDAVEGVTP